MSHSYEENAAEVLLQPAASRDAVDASSYWFDPDTASIVLLPTLTGDGPTPFDGEMVILNVRP